MQGTWGRRVDITSGLGGGDWVQAGLTLGISVISMGNAAEPLLPCGIPDLGRDGRKVRRGQGAGAVLAEGPTLWYGRCVGRRAISSSRFSQASEYLTTSWTVIATEFSSSFSAASSSPAQGLRVSSFQQQLRPGKLGRRWSEPQLV